ncbi:DNA repair protein RadA [Kangiella koreensis]|uniref:DNA repair protein RadA n=1 Tax=Kangiella koreensis (strain DSM 16069 / JCM 12317 / KCTC 12182 / SW-125) TaxID=523791 RepID=C7R774_KANKD|nr:DNA repair protein RadA [Kangiella koreensis]ACV27530.1 DNA repair protein RadA [Kangiella koreensis DSM 16069]
MAKVKTIYVCQECGTETPQWAGQCGACKAWNSLVEQVDAKKATSSKTSRFTGYSGQATKVVRMDKVDLSELPRMSSGLSELDRVLGGGLVPGSVVLMGGDPGIGKSTILLQSLCKISETDSVLYVTGEESLQQVTMRAQRLGLATGDFSLLTETQVEQITTQALMQKPKVMVVDSIQTIYTEMLQSAPGGVAQVRESAAQLVRFAKQTGITLLVVGHVTKDGALAGPRVLEHMVDAVLYFEGERDGRLRLLRAVKNRFGAVNELGVFAMTDEGLKQVKNPSAIFLSKYQDPVSGSAVMATWEGTRPMLVEIQALVDTSYAPQPRRIAVGLDHQRIAMLLAVLNRHAGIATHDQDVFANVVGGVRVMETSSDLALVASIISSLRNRPLEAHTVIFGEIGLAGEIRPVPNGQERLKEAAKHGFKRAIVPEGNKPPKAMEGLEVIGVSRMDQFIQLI